jgi:hypothetical protein
MSIQLSPRRRRRPFGGAARSITVTVHGLLRDAQLQFGDLGRVLGELELEPIDSAIARGQPVLHRLNLPVALGDGLLDSLAVGARCAQRRLATFKCPSPQGATSILTWTRGSLRSAPNRMIETIADLKRVVGVKVDEAEQVPRAVN